MGTYCSWASFALSHHLIVRLAGRLAKVQTRNQYMIIGDDIVIKGRKLAESYMRIMDNLEVGYTNEFTSTRGNSVAEFAKRLFRNGQELSPLPSRQLGHGFLSEIQFLNVAIDRGQALPEFDSIRYPGNENKFRSLLVSTYIFRILKGSVVDKGRIESVTSELHEAIYNMANDELGSSRDLFTTQSRFSAVETREKVIKYFLRFLVSSNKKLKPGSSE